ncbi:MAG: FG-GAP repeat protein [Dehalococcoidia bacterium]|nr:MAG: FG-GAP repeat protein [Dehalococcoidia bacterium]
MAAAPVSGALIALLVALAGCGGGDEGEPSPSATVTPVSGTPGPAPSTIDLATTAADLTVFGGDADDYLADRFSLAQGDFNSDGIDDILVGAPKASGLDNARKNAGEAYVIFGSSDLGGTVDIAEGQHDFTVIGTKAGDNLGFVVASGDVNGDGIDDILVGARFASGLEGGFEGGLEGGLESIPANSGEAYVVFGSPDLSGTVDTALGEQDFTVKGAHGSDFLGYALAAGDVNGDGVDDIIVAAPGADGPDNARSGAGEAYVVFGSPELTGTIDVGQEQQDFTILGAVPDDFLANFAASGDVNGDGIDDILLGTHMADGPEGQRTDGGVAYVIFGSSELKGTVDLASGEGFLPIWGADASDWLGFVLTAADVDGDGVDDLLVSARNADGLGNSRNNAGEVYVIFGSAGLPSKIDIAEEMQDVTLIGSDPNYLFGHSLASGDVNGDGLADVLVGAPAANGREKAGQVLLFLSPAQWPVTVDAALGQQQVSVPGQQELTIVGAEPQDELGFSVASGDVNGDGRDDIIGGALLADGPDNARPDAGEVHVIFGTP